MKLCWVDLRRAGTAEPAIRAEAIHHGIDAVLTDDPDSFAGLPDTMTRVLFCGGPVPEDTGGADIVLTSYLEVTDAATLDLACAMVETAEWTVLKFRDPTKIPLEIALAKLAGAKGRLIVEAADAEEAAIIFGVLEHGPDGVLLAPESVGFASRFKAAAAPRLADLELVELEVVGVRHVGMGERACIDTCSYLKQDEGILVGSQSKGLLLCASETHPLPYMPTRPFRVNAGAIMSYTLVDGQRTQYLSELRAGAEVLTVDVTGRARVVTVGRVKIETRPLLAIDTMFNGRPANLIVQDDWHVRLLGPGGAVLNSTALRPGDRVLGLLPTKDRHVGYPIDEWCHEQ